MDSLQKTGLGIVAALFAFYFLFLTGSSKYDDTPFTLKSFGLKGPVQEVIVTEVDSVNGVSRTGKMTTDSAYRPLAIQGNYLGWFPEISRQDSFVSVQFVYQNQKSPLDSVVMREWGHGKNKFSIWSRRYSYHYTKQDTVLSGFADRSTARDAEKCSTVFTWDTLSKCKIITRNCASVQTGYSKLHFTSGVPDRDSLFSPEDSLLAVTHLKFDNHSNVIRLEQRSSYFKTCRLAKRKTDAKGNITYSESSSWKTDDKNWKMPEDTSKVKTSRTWFSYKYDDRGNWIRKEERSTPDGKAEVVTTRKITYDPKAK